MADRVITPSEASRRQVIDGYDLAPDRVAAIHWGVDAQAFHPSAAGGRELVAAALGEDRPYVLFVSVAHPRKNLGVLREAMGRLVGAGFPHALALVAGPALDRPDSSDLEAAARADLPGTRNRVASVPAPSDDELAGLMAEADAFCLPSLWEGFGLTALEAMACGAPVVVSDRGAAPRGRRPTPGWWWRRTSTPSTAALQDLLGDPDRRTELGHAGRARAETFTWARTAAGWRDVLVAAADPVRARSTLNANPIGRQC